jgi:hypothetical protein
LLNTFKSRLNWAGHIMHMENGRAGKKVFNTSAEGTSKIGRPKLRREDGII